MDSYDFPMDFVGGNEPPPSHEETFDELAERFLKSLLNLNFIQEK